MLSGDDVTSGLPDDEAFYLRCTCGKDDQRWSITPPGGEARTERLCPVCARQLKVLGYEVESA